MSKLGHTGVCYSISLEAKASWGTGAWLLSLYVRSNNVLIPCRHVIATFADINKLSSFKPIQSATTHFHTNYYCNYFEARGSAKTI